MRYAQLTGKLQAIYRSRPSEESQLVATPSQEAILTFLSQIPHYAFLEFIKDILIIIEGHSLVDITDGPGDEKQDILTTTSDGERYLIQCKHKQDYRSKYNGNDLDLMLGACLRKSCRNGIFITNGTLTNQAKRYINDKEYLRGWPGGESGISIQYWDSYKIWDKISSCGIILNKWFGGLGQTHGLRTFRFDISVQQLPFACEEKEDVLDDKILDTVIDDLIASLIIKKRDDDFIYEGEIDDEISFRLSRSFQFAGNFDINYISPDEDPNYNNKPLPSLSVEIAIGSIFSFNPNTLRKKTIQYLLKNTLKLLSQNNWWHIVSGRSTSFVFLHDINEARLITLDSAETFIKVDNELYPEL